MLILQGSVSMCMKSDESSGLAKVVNAELNGTFPFQESVKTGAQNFAVTLPDFLSKRTMKNNVAGLIASQEGFGFRVVPKSVLLQA